MGFLSDIFTPRSQRMPKGRVVVQFSASRTDIVTIRRDKNSKKPLIERCQTLTGTGHGNQALSDLVKKQGLSNYPTSIVLDRQDYQLFPTDAPDLPREEWQEAVQWQIQDHIDRPASEMVVELFEIPAVQSARKKRRIYVAAAQESVLRQWSRLCIESGLALEQITIPELSFCTLASLLPEQPGGLGLLQLGRAGGLLMVIRQQTLYMARPIINSTTLVAENDTFSDASQDEVALEVRRTLDFYEGSFDQPPISALYLLPAAQPLPDLQQALSQRLNLQVKRFAIQKRVTLPPDLSDQDLVQALPAIGSALPANPETITKNLQGE
jgi:MSHA biogenesis protein MshI